jgi:hypothetical protein
MATMTSKLPTSDRPLIADRDLAAAVDKLLAPLSGTKLERAQAAVRKVAGGAAQGPFSVVVGAYESAIRAANKET